MLLPKCFNESYYCSLKPRDLHDSIIQQIPFNYKIYHILIQCTKCIMYLLKINSDDTHFCFLLDNNFPKALFFFNIRWCTLVFIHSALQLFTYKSYFHLGIYVSLVTSAVFLFIIRVSTAASLVHLQSLLYDM